MKPRPRTSSSSSTSHVPVLDSGARGSTVTFTQKQIGDVELAWENDAYLVAGRVRRRTTTRSSIRRSRSWPSRRWRWSTRTSMRMAPAQSRPNYLNYLYSAEGQTIAAKNHYRPIKPELVTDKALIDAFPKVDLVTIDDPIFGGWGKAQPKHFGDGGIFDQIYKPMPSSPAGAAPCSSPRTGWQFAKPSVIPGFGITLGLSVTYLTPDRADPAGRAGPQVGGARPGGVLAARDRRSGRSTRCR